MLKQTLIAGAALLLAAAPAFAFGGNYAHSWTSVSTTSVSGQNGVSATWFGDANHNTVNSGDSSAKTTVVTAQNTNLGGWSFGTNSAHSGTSVSTTSVSGQNGVSATGWGSDANYNNVDSGNSSATTTVVTVQNTKVSF